LLCSQEVCVCVIVYSLEKMFGGTEFYLVIYRTFRSWMLTSHSILNLSRINKYTSLIEKKKDFSPFTGDLSQY
jgi:hypothetical protein